MFKHILVPLDGSDRAEQALPVAARIARDTGASLLLFSVLRSPMMLSWQMETSLVQVESRKAEQEARLAMLAVSENIKGLKVTTEAVDDLPAHAILEKIRASSVDLVVMCSHGRSGLMRWATGSVAQKVARQSTAPVLVVRADWPMALPPHGIRPLRVMVALDGSPLAESTLLPAARLSTIISAPLPGEVHLVLVLPFSNEFEYRQDDALARAREQARQEAQIYLQNIKQQLIEQTRVQVFTSIATSLDTAETLISIAETGEGAGLPGVMDSCDIIALATHGRSGPTRWVMGSTTERILGATSLPLFVTHAHPGDVPGPSTAAQHSDALV